MTSAESTSSSAPILQDRVGEVAVLTLNRPDRLNAWTAEMERQYFDHLTALAADASVKAIVVTGAGRGFCAGADMFDLDQHSKIGPVDVLGSRPQTFPLSIPKPIIAAVNGPCAGIGFVQALMCDVRFAAEGVKFTTSFSKIGLIAEHGVSWLLAKHVGIGNALDLLMSSRIVLAEDALRMGLVARVCSPGAVLADAIGYAQDLADYVSPTAMAVIKAQVYQHYGIALSEALAKSNELMFSSLGAADFAEGVESFIGRRPPRYSGLSLEPGEL